jgi:tryptophan synthase alpha chain
MMNRIAKKFVELKDSGRKGFIPFVTAGDPDLKTSLSIIETLAKEGADVIELGVPFSDPMADGPTIQASSQRALTNGVMMSNVLDLVCDFRRRSDVPMVLFGYLNPILQYGVERFRDDAANAGIDGVLITDVVNKEAAEIGNKLNEKDIELISLVAPTTSDERLEKIAEHARGFLYAVSRTGVTGAQADLSSSAERLVERVRQYSDLPVAVGFGISTAKQIENVWKYADAAVVGSAIVAEIGRATSPDDTIDRVRMFVRRLLPQVAKTPSGI